MFNKIFVLSFSFLVISFQAFSQNSVIQKTDTIGFYRLNDVVISATKTESNLLELANSVTVIDSQKIANSSSTNVFDVIKNETGISFTRQGGVGTLSNLYIRGANSGHTLVLIDGVEMNLTSDPSGVYDFSTLPLDNIEKIEIVRGPQSTLYGSDALAGLINIITQKGNGKPKFSLLTEGGSYNTYKAQLGMNGSTERFNYSLSFNRAGSDGFSAASEKYGNTEKDGYTFNNLSGVIGYSVDENTDVNLYARYTKSKSDYDQFGGILGDDPSYIFDQEEIFFRGEGKFKFFNDQLSSKIGASFIRNVRKYEFDTSAASIFYSNSFYDGQKYKLDWQNDLSFINANVFTIGAELEFDEAFSEYYSNSYQTPSFPFESIVPMQQTRTLGLYIQDQVNLFDRLYATIGGRLDGHSKFGSQFTYRFAPAIMIWETGTKLKATVGSGFKAPSLYYLFDPAYGNESLNPEKSFGWDAGIEQFFFREKISLGVTYFNNNFKDMFGFDAVTFKTININKAETKGFEFFAQSQMIDDIELKLNYTFTDARDKSDGSSNFDTRLVRRPESKTGFYASYNFLNKANISTDITWVGTREDINFSTFLRTELKGFVLVNLAAHYDVFEFLRIHLRVENLLDKEYEEVYGYATPGQSFYGGIKVTL
ncbi:MAG: TonB-dependent receptor [Ignavibacteriales bacterium]|nr:MAG: TonB-dependent receptor [Ignavibacteriales bacterium]